MSERARYIAGFEGDEGYGLQNNWFVIDLEYPTRSPGKDKKTVARIVQTGLTKDHAELLAQVLSETRG